MRKPISKNLPMSGPSPRTSRKGSLVQSSLKLKRTASISSSIISAAQDPDASSANAVCSMISADYDLGTPIGFGSSAIVYIGIPIILLNFSKI